MTDQLILRTRQADNNHPAPAAASATEALDIEMRRAQAISQATEALPPAYRNKPGAVLLIDQWAKARGMDTLTAMQNVAFIGGKPVVEATMQRALAEQAGYEVDITEGDGWAECSVTKGGRTRSARYTLDDARTAGLLGKDNWKKNQADMLVARATARCLRRHAPSVVIGLHDPDEIDTGYDTLQTVLPPSVVEQPQPTVITPADPEPDIEEAVLDPEPEPETGVEEWTVDTLKVALRNAGITQSDALRTASMHGGGVATIAALVDHPDLIDKVLYADKAEPEAGTLTYTAEEEAPF